jgi:hypothetical protein
MGAGGSEAPRRYERVRAQVRKMIEADDQLITAVVGGDAGAYAAADKMPARDVLNLCVAYLRKVNAQIQSSKRHGRKGNH